MIVREELRRDYNNNNNNNMVNKYNLTIYYLKKKIKWHWLGTELKDKCMTTTE